LLHDGRALAKTAFKKPETERSSSQNEHVGSGGPGGDDKIIHMEEGNVEAMVQQQQSGGSDGESESDQEVEQNNENINNNDSALPKKTSSTSIASPVTGSAPSSPVKQPSLGSDAEF